jgi:FAD/FMN-containing dehydrogenase
LSSLLTAGLEPFLLELLSFVPLGELGYNVVVGFSGSAEQVAYQVNQARGLLEPGGSLQELSQQEAQSAMQELRNLRVSGQGVARVKASLLPTQVVPFIRKLEEEGGKNTLRMAVQAHAGNGIVHVRIRTGQGNIGATGPVVQTLGRLRNFAQDSGGSLVLVEAAQELKKRVGPWGAAVPAATLMLKLKDALDPKHIFSPGRFFPEKGAFLRP